MTDVDSKSLIVGLSAADERAAKELFGRYVGRLIELARSRLSPKLARRIDPEDVVQSACRSFFRNARGGRYELRQSSDLWRLLAAITVNKVRRQVERNTAARRTVAAEESWAGGDSFEGVLIQSIAREPSPEEAATLAEETAHVMSQLSPLYRKILELRLQATPRKKLRGRPNVPNAPFIAPWSPSGNCWSVGYCPTRPRDCVSAHEHQELADGA